MALLSPVAIGKDGVVIGGANLTEPDATDTARPDGRAFLVVNNATAGSIDVTFVTPGALETGADYPDKVIAVPAGEIHAMPLLDVYRDPADGLIHISYSATTSVTRGLFRR